MKRNEKVCFESQFAMKNYVINSLISKQEIILNLTTMSTTVFSI